jgi:hypothetical protein
MKTRILLLYLQLFLFYSLLNCLYAQTDDIKKGTFYETGGKIFEVISNDKAYQFKLSYDDTKKEYNIELIKPRDEEQKEKSATFINLDNNSINNAIKELNTVINEIAKNNIIEQIMTNKAKYETNKIEYANAQKMETFEKQIKKEKKEIGKIEFRKDIKSFYVDVYSYIYDQKAGEYTKIGCFKVENAQIAFGDGIISKININGYFHKYEKADTCDEIVKKYFSDNKKVRKITFYNSLPPIPIRTMEQIDYFNTCDGEERYWLTTQYQDIDDDSEENIYFIYLSDILYYEQKLIFNYGIYIPPDGKVITLDNISKEIVLEKESFINDFDLRIYTDVSALSADNPNGLVKFMGNYNFKINNPRLNTSFEEKPRWLFCWSNYMNVFFNFNKLEDDKLITPIRIANKKLHSTSFDLYRYSKFELGIDWNQFKWQSESMSICFNILGGVYHTPIDSTYKNKTDTVTISNGVNSFYFGSKLNFKFQANEYVDFDLSYSFIIPQLFSNNKIKEIYKSIGDDKFLTNNRGTYFNFDSWIHNIRAEFSIYPDPQDKSSFVFLRSGLVFNSSDNYITLMLGYSLPFSSLISIGQSVK